MTVYLDLVVILNFLVDFLLILGTNCLSGYPLSAKRAAWAAAMGGLYAAACFLPVVSFLGNTLWRGVSLLGMGAVAFGLSQSGFRRTILFLFLTMALGGMATVLNGGGFWTLIFAAFGVAVLCFLGFQNHPGQQQFASVTICHQGRRVRLTALLDTGNTLKDPISGRSVLVVDAQVAEKLLDLTQEQLQHPVETLAHCSGRGLRLLPYHAVGQPAGLMLGLRVERLEINGKQEEMVIGFAPQRIGEGKSYQALAGGNGL